MLSYLVLFGVKHMPDGYFLKLQCFREMGIMLHNRRWPPGGDFNIPRLSKWSVVVSDFLYSKTYYCRAQDPCISLRNFLLQNLSLKTSFHRSVLLLLCCSFAVTESFAGLFYEHKYIGDQAFIQFIQSNHLNEFFRNSLGLRQFGVDVDIPYKENTVVAAYYKNMFGFPAGGTMFSYGDLTGLAGDHTIDGEQLFEGLFLKQLFESQCPGYARYAKLRDQLRNALADHIKGIEKYQREGSYFSIPYAELANEDQSHFQRPPENFEEMISAIDPEMISLAYKMYTTSCAADSTVYPFRTAFDKKITQIPNAAKYALLHAIALRFMLNAALAMDDDPDMAKKAILNALLFNAFADHFLQDAFASGHMSVQRSKRGFNNKGVHDYYNRIGLQVKNEMGDSLHTYGDDYYTEAEFVLAIKADAQSLQELWDYYSALREKKKADPDYGAESLYDSLRRNQIDHSTWGSRILQDFGAYRSMPIPLTPEKYAENKLKNGSKTGGYYGIGYGMFTSNPNHDANFMISGSIGIFLPLYPVRILPPKDEHRNIESVFWLGLALGYNYVQQDGYAKNQAMIKTPLTFFDKFIIEPSWGLSWYAGTSHSTWIFTAGYEWKTLKNFWAPSLNYFIQDEKGSPTAQGIKLIVNFY